MTAPFFLQQETTMKMFLKATALVVLIAGAYLADCWRNLNPLQRAVYSIQIAEMVDDLDAIGRLYINGDRTLHALFPNVALPPCKYSCGGAK